MRFHIRHRTHYRYAGTALESFMEARLTPVTDDHQRLISRKLVSRPDGKVHAYTDYFGNTVETLAIVRRHRELLLESVSEVETFSSPPPEAALEISLSEARQIYRKALETVGAQRIVFGSARSTAANGWSCSNT